MYFLRILSLSFFSGLVLIGVKLELAGKIFLTLHCSTSTGCATEEEPVEDSERI